MSLTLGRSPSIESLIRTYEHKFPKAIARALNRAGTSTRALMSSLAAKDMGLKTGTVKDQIKVTPAAESRHVVRLTATGKRIPLIEWVRDKNLAPTRGRRGRGVSARLPGGAGRYPHAFIARMPSGHVGVFQRRATGRLPIYQLHGPSLPKVFEKFTPEGLARGGESLKKNLIHELRFASSQS